MNGASSMSHNRARQASLRLLLRVSSGDSSSKVIRRPKTSPMMLTCSA